jgi:hypothetical protein
VEKVKGVGRLSGLTVAKIVSTVRVCVIKHFVSVLEKPHTPPTKKIRYMYFIYIAAEVT